MMEQRLTLITLGVTDLKKARHFYEEKFGWKPLPASTDDIVFFQLNNLQLALFPDTALAKDAHVDPHGSGFKKFSLAYNTRSEKEVDDLIMELESRGVTVIKRPQKVFWGGYSAYVADLDNNLWEIAYNPYLLP
jgi:catechol 2,3-dioxygenase-like lactoylglutathione lyase family enzyme